MENDPRKRRPSTPRGTPKGWSLKKSEAKQLLEEGHWTPDPENSATDLDAYVSDRGELLLFMQRGRSILYASRQEEMDYLAANFSKKVRSYHMLEGVLPQGAHFIEAVPSLVDELAKLLKLPRESLDGSLKSLEPVDAALRKLRPRRRALEIPNLFAAIVAYTGEVMRKLSGGTWKLVDAGGGIFEPYIQVDDDPSHDMNPWLYPWDDIHESKPGGVSLTLIVSTYLAWFEERKLPPRKVEPPPIQTPLSWALPKYQAKELLQSGQWTRDPENSSEECKAFTNEQGQLLLIDKFPNVRLVQSRSEWMDYLARMREHEKTS
jgi:hypothetical protein